MSKSLSLKLLSNRELRSFDFSKSEFLLELSRFFRILLSFLGLVALLGFDFYQKEFINLDFLRPLFQVLSFTFALHTASLLLPSRLEKKEWLNFGLYALDLFFLGLFMYFFGMGHSFFSILFLITILMSGFVLSRLWVFHLAVWSVLLFNWALLGHTETWEASVYLTLALNNISFLSVAFFSTTFAQQIREQGQQIKAQSSALDALEEVNHLIIENIASGIMTINRFGLITYSNEASERIFSENSLLGQPITHVLPHVSLELQKVTNDKGVHRFEAKCENKEGRKMVVEVFASILRNENQEEIGKILLLQDFTELKRLQFNIQQKEKLAAVGQLAAGIAHEIRNPLASISGSIQMIDRSMHEKLKPEDKKLINIINREVSRLDNLIEEFLVFVKPEEESTTPVDVSVVLQSVVETLMLDQKLLLKTPPDIDFSSSFLIYANEDKLKQVFLNILINAYQAISNEVKEVSIRTYHREDWVVVSIKDNGEGMSEDQVNRIFEPFYTTKEKGTGLGMAISHKILKSIGAHIFVESSPGLGSTFTIEFPIADHPYPKSNFEVQKIA